MRNIHFIYVAMIFCVVACTKTQNSAGGTTNPPPDDTSTLMKTLINFNYDQSGNVTDTSVNSWFYDGSGRVTKRLIGVFGTSYYDSTETTYSTNQSVTNVYSYQGGTQILEYHTTAYLNSYGNADSSVTVEPGAAQVSRNFYDAMQHDTLSQNYNRIGNDLILNSLQRNYYTGEDLDSVKQSDAKGNIQFKSIWLNGNIVVDSSYQGGTLWVAHAYAYDNTIHRGWQQYDGTKNMLISFTQTFFNPSQIDPVETLIYTYDAANRVQTLTRLKGGTVYAKQFYTYY